ncbi:MAG TPA: BrnT family toxin [Candidatus Binataceae bacterium]|nr:BrnT family toxin [Candidatus Binataceae bacterium]
MVFGAAGFDWDGANRAKCQKHGVTIAAIEAMFQKPIAVFPNPRHSRTEERFIAIGKDEDSHAVLAVFTMRTRDLRTLIRLISARYMHKKEVEHYEKEAAKIKDR